MTPGSQKGQNVVELNRGAEAAAGFLRGAPPRTKLFVSELEANVNGPRVGFPGSFRMIPGGRDCGDDPVPGRWGR